MVVLGDVGGGAGGGEGGERRLLNWETEKCEKNDAIERAKKRMRSEGPGMKYGRLCMLLVWWRVCGKEGLEEEKVINSKCGWGRVSIEK